MDGGRAWPTFSQSSKITWDNGDGPLWTRLVRSSFLSSPLSPFQFLSLVSLLPKNVDQFLFSRTERYCYKAVGAVRSIVERWPRERGCTSNLGVMKFISATWPEATNRGSALTETISEVALKTAIFRQILCRTILSLLLFAMHTRALLSHAMRELACGLEGGSLWSNNLHSLERIKWLQ